MVDLKPGQWTYEIIRHVDLDAYELQVHGVRESDCRRIGMRRPPLRPPDVFVDDVAGLLNFLVGDAHNCAAMTDGVSGEPVDPIVPEVVR